MSSNSSKSRGGLDTNQKLMMGGLALVIAVAIGWSGYLIFGTSREATVSFEKPVEKAQFQISFAVMTEKNKVKFSDVHIQASQDGTKVEINGTVKKKEDLEELKAIIEQARAGFAVQNDTKIGA